jgi:hypothetical protein
VPIRPASAARRVGRQGRTGADSAARGRGPAGRVARLHHRPARHGRAGRLPPGSQATERCRPAGRADIPSRQGASAPWPTERRRGRRRRGRRWSRGGPDLPSAYLTSRSNFHGSRHRAWIGNRSTRVSAIGGIYRAEGLCGPRLAATIGIVPLGTPRAGRHVNFAAGNTSHSPARWVRRATAMLRQGVPEPRPRRATVSAAGTGIAYGLGRFPTTPGRRRFAFPVAWLGRSTRIVSPR